MGNGNSKLDSNKIGAILQKQADGMNSEGKINAFENRTETRIPKTVFFSSSPGPVPEAEPVGARPQRGPADPRAEAVGPARLVAAGRGHGVDGGPAHPGGGPLRGHLRADREREDAGLPRPDPQALLGPLLPVKLQGGPKMSNLVHYKKNLGYS